MTGLDVYRHQTEVAPPSRPKASGLSKALAAGPQACKAVQHMNFDVDMLVTTEPSFAGLPLRCNEMDQVAVLNLQVSRLTTSLQEAEKRLSDKEALLRGNVVRTATRIKTLEEAVRTLQTQLELRDKEVTSLSAEVVYGTERIAALEAELAVFKERRSTCCQDSTSSMAVSDSEEERVDDDEEEGSWVLPVLAPASVYEDEIQFLRSELLFARSVIETLQSTQSPESDASSRLKSAEKELEVLRSEAVMRDEIITKLKRTVMEFQTGEHHVSTCNNSVGAFGKSPLLWNTGTRLGTHVAQRRPSTF
mmetsp:Transcript_5372/g.8330  ORF Transcript_5372/g.8330 Transcript_5372/m.8330 type:complete len:306 (+) Transcript_5372:233-1150(+)|eukprot:CAMPEP_0184643490 /NCGR_PEP_ID=MMETSP0308-20130426/347_1 /TAXON_ID=38269 /ORGANISM="Gloeochaete witrockiana, Strain SAG 46.84" /LENGTH=305 /DNA_ID=CAMNT_0027071471 /DNA_START=209 /DNA_END=1126 /DNA_ORIENTATION=+